MRGLHPKMPPTGHNWGDPRDLPPGVLDMGQQDVGEQIFRALGLKGTIPHELDRRIQLGITALDLTRPEFSFLRRESLGWGGGNALAVAGQFPFGSLRGAANVLLTVDEVWITNLNAAPITCQIGTQAVFPSGAGATNGVPRDTRLGITTTLAGATRSGNDAAPALPSVVFLMAVPATSSVVIRPGVVLASATSFLSVIGNTVNTQLSVSFFWRERSMISSEQ